jgi:hypothetical protein
MRTRPPTSTQSRGAGIAATAGAAASKALAVRAARAGASSRGGRWQGLDAERGGGRRRHLLEPLAVHGEGVSLQGLGGVSLRLAGKLVAPRCLNAVAPGQLVHIVDQLTGRLFLIDTGVSYSIFPHRSTSRPTGLLLTGASGQRIPCWGESAVQLDFHGRRFEWTFLLADVSFAIIGVDFLRSHKLSVNPAANRLVDTALLQSFVPVSAAAARAASTIQSPPSPESTGHCGGDAPACAASAGQSPPSPESTGRCGGDATAAASPPAPPPLSPEWLKAFLAEFEDVVCPSKVLPPVGTDVEHHVKTSGPPIASRLCRLDAKKLAAAKAEFLQLEKDGIFRRSDSPWSSPLHMVRKVDGSWRPCGDFRRLNMVTVTDLYPLPNMLDFASKAAGSTIFTKIDLRKGYHQIPVHPADIQKTTITMPFGSSEYLGMPSGLMNAGATFQRKVHRAVTGFPRPSTVKELQMFLGMVNFYSRFLPGVARALRPLTDCLRGCPKGPAAVEWNGGGRGGGHRDAE